LAAAGVRGRRARSGADEDSRDMHRLSRRHLFTPDFMSRPFPGVLSYVFYISQKPVSGIAL